MTLIMNALYYFYYRMHRYYYRNGENLKLYAKLSAYIALVTMLFLNILSIYIIISMSITGDITFVNNFRIYSPKVNEFIVMPLLMSPVVFIVFLLLNIGKRRDAKIKQFEQESLEQRKRNGKYVVMYIVGTIILMLLGITSSLWLPLLGL